MGKSKSHPCRHPRTALCVVDSDETTLTFFCKKCNGTFTMEEAKGTPEGYIRMGEA
jgi:transcription elongation factor Elf1